MYTTFIVNFQRLGKFGAVVYGAKQHVVRGGGHTPQLGLGGA